MSCGLATTKLSPRVTATNVTPDKFAVGMSPRRAIFKRQTGIQPLAKNLQVLRVALAAIQASGMTARALSERSGLSIPTCQKILRDKDGVLGYHWSSIEFALRFSGNRLIVVAERSAAEQSRTQEYTRRFGRRKMS